MSGLVALQRGLVDNELFQCGGHKRLVPGARKFKLQVLQVQGAQGGGGCRQPCELPFCKNERAVDAHIGVMPLFAHWYCRSPWIPQVGQVLYVVE